ncbi:MAG TPA: ABC transporter permease [Cyclobacteriaceae bacterium]|nr:ABC transporter permease [Cyclobacteriaceae bacterium]
MRHEDDTLPGWARGFLKIVCPDHFLEEIEGDLVQKYEFDIQQYGFSRARRKLFWNIFRFLRPGIFMRSRFSFQSNPFIMLRNYIVTALRVSRRQGLYAFINVLGLSLGLSVTLLIGIYISDELSYDRHIPDAERIFRVGINETFKGDEILYSDTGAPLAETMRQEMPAVEDAVRVVIYNAPVRYEDRAIMEKRFMGADSNFFSFFGYQLIEGNPRECLKGPGKIVLTSSAAKKYFDYDGTNGSSPVGKQLIVGRRAEVFEVTAIANDPPENTHMKFAVIISLESLAFSKGDCWGCYGLKTYFKTVNESGIAEVEEKLEDFAQHRIIPGIEKSLNISHDQFVKSGDIVKFFVQPLLSIHLQSSLDNEFEPNGDLRYVYIFGAVGLFVVIIACINFMNLSTARAMSRGREVGVRKTMGATWRGLIPQFMTESFLYVIVSSLLAILMAYAALGTFNSLSGKDLHIDLFGNISVIGYSLLFLFVVGVLAGAYPAFYLSSFNPVNVLKSGKQQGAGGSFIRSSLVVFQFAISIVLIIGTLIIYKQVQFIRSHDLGFDKENVLRIPQSFMLGGNHSAFKEEMLRHSEFVDASYSESLPPDVSSTGFIKADHSDQLVSVYLNASDYDFAKTMRYEMKSGRFFSREFISDSNAVVINEACARMMDFDSHEGKKLGFGGGDNTLYHVIGIVKDFNFASLKSNIQPIAMFLNKGADNNFVVRMTPGDPGPKIELAQSIWKKYANGNPFQYSFIDEDYDRLFRAEQRLGKVFVALTVMAVVIACLGLFGLITYTTAQRTKEIGIRKVLGASPVQLTLLLLSNMTRLLLISFLISIPLAWYGMDQWLQSFAYRTDFDILSVVIAGVAGLLIAVLTVGYRSVRAALINPVDSLRNE